MASNPVIVGIAGGTASGKTTLASKLAEMLGDKAVRICHDRYYKPVDPAISSRPDRVLVYNYDHPDALETSLLVEHLRTLRQGNPVQVPDYEYGPSCRTPEHTWETICPRPVILVEGILILADPALRAELDLSVFVEVPDDVRLARRMRRDIVERAQAPHEVIDQYLTMVRPMHTQFVEPSKDFATLVLNGNGPYPIEDLATLVMSRINDRLSRQGK